VTDRSLDHPRRRTSHHGEKLIYLRGSQFSRNEPESKVLEREKYAKM